MFEDYVVETTKANPNDTGAKVALTKSGRFSTKAKLQITLKLAVAANLDWRNNDRLQVQIGSGEHHGRIRLRKNNSVGSAVALESGTAKGGYIRIRLGHLSKFVDRRESSRHVQFHQVMDGEGKFTGWVEFIMPSWAAETAPAKPRNIPPPPPDWTVSSRPRRDVAPTLMGDPPPGRRAAS